MTYTKNDVEVLIKTRKEDLQCIQKGDVTYSPLKERITKAENMLPDIEEGLNSSQEEVYKELLYAM